MNQPDSHAAVESDLLETLVRFQEGALAPAECEALARELARSPHARQQFIAMQMRAMAIHDHFRRAAYRSGGRATGRSWRHWILSRTVATAAGIVLGICCTSLAFAYALPKAGRLSTMFFDSFEAGPPPLTNGVPVAAGHWGGDYVEIVERHAGVQPAHGDRMLRFLRGDHEGMPRENARSSHTFRLFDVRGMREELRHDTAIVQLSALFNAAPAEEPDPVTCALSIFAIDEQTVDGDGLRRAGVLSRDSLAMAVSSEVTLDDDPASWQRVTNELRLPPETAYVMIRVGVSRKHGSATPDFPSHYVDDVRLVLGHRPELVSQ
jgi:hypothetical protein